MNRSQYTRSGQRGLVSWGWQHAAFSLQDSNKFFLHVLSTLKAAKIDGNLSIVVKVDVIQSCYSFKGRRTVQEQSWKWIWGDASRPTSKCLARTVRHSGRVIGSKFKQDLELKLSLRAEFMGEKQIISMAPHIFPTMLTFHSRCTDTSTQLYSIDPPFQDRLWSPALWLAHARPSSR